MVTKKLAYEVQIEIPETSSLEEDLGKVLRIGLHSPKGHGKTINGLEVQILTFFSRKNETTASSRSLIWMKIRIKLN